MKNFRSPLCALTHSKLAKNIAQTIERFIKVGFSSQLPIITSSLKPQTAMDPDKDPRWKVGPGHIKMVDFIFVGLQCVQKLMAVPHPPQPTPLMATYNQ